MAGRGGCTRFRRDRRPLFLKGALAVPLVALVFASIVASAALHLLENAEPVLSADQPDVLGRRHSADRLDEQGIAARVLGDAAAATEHVKPDPHVFGTDQADDVI